MAHNLNNIIVDRVLRGIFSDKNDNIIFSLNQVQNLSLNQTSESQEVTDALGVSIMELMRAKALEASAENAIYDFGLLAAQYGTEKVSGDAVVTPKMETFSIAAADENGKYMHNLAHMPIKTPVEVYELNGDSTLGEKYVYGEKAEPATADHPATFAYVDGVIELPAVDSDAEFFVMYEYMSDNAMEVVNSANQFAKMGKMTFEILAYDVCDPETKLFGYLVLPRFQLSNDFDWSIGGDSQTHAFSGKAMVDYCQRDKKMVRVVIVDDEE